MGGRKRTNAVKAAPSCRGTHTDGKATVRTQIAGAAAATTRGSTGSRQSDIAARAYQLWEARGRGHGGDLSDWLQAELELKS